jgi:pimeloyl-ACP methyl ester carboxylesterase
MIEALLAAQFAVLAIDVRGVGETAASDFEATTNALMSDRPLFGQRVWDVLRAVDWLRGRTQNSIQIDKERIGCMGRGAAGLLALYAAALDERLVATVVWESPASYKSLIVERPGFPPSTYLFDVLNHFDLPHLMAGVAPRSLLLAGPVDGERQVVPAESLTEPCQWPRNVYSLLQAEAEGLQVLAGLETQGAVETIARWLQEHM